MLEFCVKHFYSNPKSIILNTNVKKQYFIIFVFFYYLVAILSALFDGLSIILISIIFTNFDNISQILSKYYVFEFILGGQSKLEIDQALIFLLITLSVAFVLKWINIFSEGVFVTYFRKKIQISLFRKIINGSWEQVRDFRTGHLVNINTLEAVWVSKYLVSLVAIPSCILISSTFISLAVLTNMKIAFFIILICLPMFLFMKFVIKRQSILSKYLSNIRSKYSADLTDRFSGILEVFISNRDNFHFSRGIRTQKEYTITEIKIYFLMSIIQTLHLSVTIFILAILLLIYFFLDFQINSFIFTDLATLCLLGLKIISQINAINLNIGNLVRLSGSLSDVFKIFYIKSKKVKKNITSRIDSLILENIEFNYNNKKLFQNLNLNFKKGKVNLITGRSGKGKTTIAYLINGLLNPNKGKRYFVSKGKKYSIDNYQIDIGFVNQNLYFFEDSIRDNLTLGREVKDEKIWEVLNIVDGIDFVKNSGSLSNIIFEGGKNFSGGQIRRLGIARALLSGAKILVLDEPTSGLDRENKQVLLKIIKKLCQKYLLILISHEDLHLPSDIINVCDIKNN